MRSRGWQGPWQILPRISLTATHFAPPNVPLLQPSRCASIGICLIVRTFGPNILTENRLEKLRANQGHLTGSTRRHRFVLRTPGASGLFPRGNAKDTILLFEFLWSIAPAGVEVRSDSFQKRFSRVH